MSRFPKIIAFVAGLVSALGFAPVGAWPLTLGAFAVLLVLVKEAPNLRGALSRGYLFGMGHFIVGLNWIAGAFAYQDTMPASFGWGAVVLVAAIVSIYPAFAGGLAWMLGRAKPVGFTLIFAGAWIIGEWLRSILFSGFAWNPLGVALIDIPLVRDTARIVGTYGLSAWITILAGVIAFRGPRWIAAIRNNWKNGTWLSYALGGPVLLVLAVIVAASAINRIDLFTYPAKASQRPVVRVVQPNIGQQDKHVPAFAKVNFAKLKSLTGTPANEPRLILWPEAAIPDYLDESDADAKDARARITALLGSNDVLLTGGVKRYFKRRLLDGYIEEELIGARNSVFAVDARGKLLARYDKAHLVPGGEYLPMKDAMSAIGLSRLVPGTVDFWPGPGARSLTLPGFGKVGVQICYEMIFAGRVVDSANRPDFVFNPSNDAWFGAWGPPQHLAQARLRAIEEAMPVIRSTPTGISAVIDARGLVLKSVAFQQAGFIETRLPAPAPATLFAMHGNIISLILAFLLGALGVALNRRAR